jgi:aspartate/methionine/tyrosine aminotransferase
MGQVIKRMRPGEKAVPFAQRVQHLRAEGAYEVLALAQSLEAAGRDIIHLELGEPDFRPAEPITQAGIKAIHGGKTRYNPPRGITEIREAIAADAGRRRGVHVRPEQVVIGPGAKPALFFPTLALVEPGDEVIYPDPGFPTYEAMIGVAGGVPVPVPVREETGFSFDLDAFDNLVNDRTRVIVLNSPANPTGGVIPRQDLEHIARAALRHDCWVLADEIYARLAYDGLAVPSIAAVDGMAERTVIVDGFSKTYAMTGWRLGFGIMPAALAERVSLLLTHSIGCTAHFTQYAGLQAVLGDQAWVDEMVMAYQQRRDVLVARLNAIPGVSTRTPQGAFYVFPNITGLGMSSSEMARLLLEKAGVAVLPGTAFGRFGEGYLRIAYCNSLENIERALERIQEVVARL